jgi:threonine dehydrogenase-like Zn-dependent dehydrogenase
VKAIAVFPYEKRVELIDHPAPELTSSTSVKLRMLEVGICGTDKEIVAFDYGTPPDGSPYLILGHESLGEVIETGPDVTTIKPGDLAVPTVRRPCAIETCTACRMDRQDFCYTGAFTERGIKQRHGFLCEFVVEEEHYIHPVPAPLRDVAVLVEPLTIAEKGISQLWQIQQRLPWARSGKGLRAVVLGGGPVGLLGAMKLVLEGFETFVYSRTPAVADIDKIVTGFGAKFVHAETATVADLAAMVGHVDVVYEAVGASGLAFDMLQYLGNNGVFIFTGVPGRKGPISVDADAMMRSHVLKNHIIFGTVNASAQSFADAIDDLARFTERWPIQVRSLITNRIPIERALEPLSGKVGGIKNVLTI